MRRNRFANENALRPDNQPRPRIVYPNDILPDVNPLSEMNHAEQEDVVKTDSSNPRG